MFSQPIVKNEQHVQLNKFRNNVYTFLHLDPCFLNLNFSQQVFIVDNY